MIENITHYISELFQDAAKSDTELILLAILIVVAVIIIDATSMMSKRLQSKTGIAPDAKAIGIDGFDTLPVKDYISDIQGIAGRPDAVIVEEGNLIPVERKPLSKKLRDRHVAQLLIYMRLIEEFEGKKPPYGYLILGEKCRRVKVKNSDEKQKWLQTKLDEMREILNDNAEPIPSPFKPKCKRCSFKEQCSDAIL